MWRYVGILWHPHGNSSGTWSLVRCNVRAHKIQGVFVSGGEQRLMRCSIEDTITWRATAHGDFRTGQGSDNEASDNKWKGYPTRLLLNYSSTEKRAATVVAHAARAGICNINFFKKQMALGKCDCQHPYFGPSIQTFHTDKAGICSTCTYVLSIYFGVRLISL